MNWISNYVRPKINSLFSRREVPENLWTKCTECGTMLFHRELAGNLNVCTSCDHHMAITPRDRFTSLFDGGIFTEVKVPEPPSDPLHFRDQKKYPDRLKAAQKASGEREAMLVAEGEMGRTPIVAAAQVGKTHRILTESPRLGRTEQFTEVTFAADQPEGAIVTAQISGTSQDKLLAK